LRSANLSPTALRWAEKVRYPIAFQEMPLAQSQSSEVGATKKSDELARSQKHHMIS
jgi:hypothetical protein